jgi:hypothetical protein
MIAENRSQLAAPRAIVALNTKNCAFVLAVVVRTPQLTGRNTMDSTRRS